MSPNRLEALTERPTVSPDRLAALTERPAALVEAGGTRASTASMPAGRPDGSSVSVVIPTINEASSIGWVLGRLPPFVSEVVLVDGLSTDETEIVARASRPDIVVVHQRQRGKGAALRAGFAVAKGDIVVMLDADGSTDPDEIKAFVDAVKAGADLVKGSRNLDHAGSADATRVRRAGNRAFVWLSNLLYGAHFTDLCYGFCAFRASAVEKLALSADGFEIEAQLVLRAVTAGLRVHEVPSRELARQAGNSNLHAVRDGRRVLRTILAERHNDATRRPTAELSFEVVAESARKADWQPSSGHDCRTRSARGA